GMCEVKTAALILATGLFPDAAVAFHRAAAAKHHLAVLLRRFAGHAGGGELEAQAVAREDLGEEVDVAARRDHAVVVARQYRLLLLLAHWPLVQVGALVGLEFLAVLGPHQ